MADIRRSVTGTTIALASIPPIGAIAIIDRTRAGAVTTATRATRVTPVTAVTGATIAIQEVILRSALSWALGDPEAKMHPSAR